MLLASLELFAIIPRNLLLPVAELVTAATYGCRPAAAAGHLLYRIMLT
jgi:hypothetical protein